MFTMSLVCNCLLKHSGCELIRLRLPTVHWVCVSTILHLNSIVFTDYRNSTIIVCQSSCSLSPVPLSSCSLVSLLVFKADSLQKFCLVQLAAHPVWPPPCLPPGPTRWGRVAPPGPCLLCRRGGRGRTGAPRTGRGQAGQGGRRSAGTGTPTSGCQAYKIG